jgi:hypothetical protein
MSLQLEFCRISFEATRVGGLERVERKQRRKKKRRSKNVEKAGSASASVSVFSSSSTL